MTEPMAPKVGCATHPDQSATGSCPRCGGFCCESCLPPGNPRFCLACRDQLELGARPSSLRCLCCEGPLELGYMSYFQALRYYELASFRKWFRRGFWLVTAGRPWREQFGRFMRMAFTNTYLVADRCEACRIVVLSYQKLRPSREIKALLQSENNHHALAQTCPNCDDFLTHGYIHAGSPTQYYTLESFGEWFGLAEDLFHHGMDTGERMGRWFGRLGSFDSYWNPCWHCRSCELMVLEYGRQQGRRSINKLARQVEEWGAESQA